MRKHTLFFLVLLLVTLTVQAQKNVELINSGDILEEGQRYQDNNKYGKAINLYKQVSRNDTAYEQVLLELAVSYGNDEQDSMAMETCLKGIALHGSTEPVFYNILGYALKQMERYDEAIKKLDEGIAKYPRIAKLHMSKAGVYFKMKKYAEAIPCYQRTIELNVFNEEAHFMLGKCLIEQGRTVPAILSFEFFLLMENNTNRSTKVITQLEDLYSDEYESDPDLKMTSREAGDQAFDDIAELLSSKIALSKGYKDRTGLNLKLTRQRQLLLEKLHYEAGTGNWFMENYVPFLVAVQQKNYSVPFSLYTMGTLSSKKITKAIKHKKRQIMSFAQWAAKELVELRKNRKEPLYGTEKGLQHIYYDNRILAGIGKLNASEQQVGDWLLFSEQTGNLMAKAFYNSKGERDGLFETYFENGKVCQRVMYKNGKREGETRFWYDNGQLSTIVNFTDDVEDGHFETYNYGGAKQQEGNFKKGKLDGPLTVYFIDGTKNATMNYVNGELDGELNSWWPNGKPSRTAMYKAGKKDGPIKDYHQNGKTEFEGNYTNDETSGNWKYYYTDGVLNKEGAYNDKGKPTGVWKEYYNNSKLLSETHYDNEGNLDGETTTFDDDGKKLATLVYKKDIMQSNTTFNKKGEVIHEDKADGKNIEVTTYWFNGLKRSEGGYQNGEKEGEWKYYSSSGGLELLETLEKGKGEGKRKEYYINGQVKNECALHDNQYDGYFKSYFTNGKLESEGWFVKDNREGDWYFYNSHGVVTSHHYYLEGKEYGYQEYFDAKGRLSEEKYMKHEVMKNITIYDSTGKVEYAYITEDGNGTYQYKSLNGKLQNEIFYKSGLAEGTRSVYYWSGQKFSEINYLHGQFDGKIVTYFEDGKIATEANYILGDADGISRKYWENGKLRSEDQLVLGEFHGTDKLWHDNGQLKREGQYVQGKAEGEFSYYAYDGTLICKRWYHLDALVAYSYLGKDGKLLDKIEVNGDIDSLVTYFPNGQKAMETHYKNGVLNGRRVEYFTNGKIADDENFVAGDSEGEQKYYYSNGNLRKVYIYLADEEDGTMKEYYENGKLKRSWTSICDDKYGTLLEYDANGKLTTTSFYSEGVCLSQQTSK